LGVDWELGVVALGLDTLPRTSRSDVRYDQRMEVSDVRRRLRDRLEAMIGRGAGMSIVSRDAERLPGHVLILVEHLRADMLVLALDRAGFAVAAGSACAAGSAAPSHVLLAQGLTPDDARSVIRVSIGLDTTAEEVDGFWAALVACAERLRTGALPVTDVA